MDRTSLGVFKEPRATCYCSPVIQVRKSDRKAVLLHSVALTNKPAIDAMIPIVNKNGTKQPDQTGEPTEEGAAPAGESSETDVGALLEMLTELLQLPASASMEEIFQAVAGLIQNQTSLKLKVDSMEFETYKAKAEDVVELALKTGKLAPYQRDWAFKNAMNDVDDFSLWLKNAPQVVPMGAVDVLDAKPPKPKSRSHELLGAVSRGYYQVRHKPLSCPVSRLLSQQGKLTRT